MKSWLADLIRADRVRLAGAGGIGVISVSLVWSSLGIAGPMGVVLAVCGCLGVVAAGGLVVEEVDKSRASRLSRQLADHEEVERLRLEARSERTRLGQPPPEGPRSPTSGDPGPPV